MRRKLCAILGVLSWAGLSGAFGGSFTISVSVAGAPGVIPGTSRALLVTDAARDGFLGFGDADRRDADVRLLPLESGRAVGDDTVLAAMEAITVNGVALIESGVFEVDTAEAIWGGLLQTGDPLGLLLLYDGHLQEGARVGLYRADAVTDPQYGGNHAYVVPSEGASVRIVSVAEGVILVTGVMGNVALSEFTNSDVMMPAPLFGQAVEVLRFDPPTSDEGSSMMAELATPVASLYVVEKSLDLKQWSLLEEREIVSESIWSVNDVEAGERAFYRWWRMP